MTAKKRLTTSSRDVGAQIKILESDETTPPGYYISIKGRFAGEAISLWSDDVSKGIEQIEKRAIFKIGQTDCNFILYLKHGEILAAIGRKGQANGSVCNIGPDGLAILLSIEQTGTGLLAVDLIRNGLICKCTVEYTADYHNSKDVKISRYKADGLAIINYRIRKLTGIVSFTLHTKTDHLDVERLRAYSEERRPFYRLKLYGLKHYDRVAENGRRLWVEGANPDVIAAFAYLHDLERTDAETDPGHGERVAELIDRIRPQYLSTLTDLEIDLLKQACKLHEAPGRTGNNTIDICLDADRLDLPRLGVYPAPLQMATAKGQQLANELSEESKQDG